MEKTKHCTLCIHRIQDFNRGALCGFTSKKPVFENKCPLIRFGDELLLELEHSNISLEVVKRRKLVHYLHFTIFSIISIMVLMVPYIFRDYFFQVSKSSIPHHAFQGTIFSYIIPLIFIAIGLYLLSLSFGYFNKYNSDYSIALKRKKQIDYILQQYNIKYEGKLDFGKKYLDVQEVEVNIKFNSKNLTNENIKTDYPRTVIINALEL